MQGKVQGKARKGARKNKLSVLGIMCYNSFIVAL